MGKNALTSIHDDFFYGVFNNSMIGRIITDDKFNVILANNKMFSLLGLLPYDVSGMSFGSAFKCSDLGLKCRMCGLYENHKNCGIISDTVRMIRGEEMEGSIIRYSCRNENRIEIKWFKITGCLVHHMGRSYISLDFDDITDIKQRERHLTDMLSIDMATGTMNKYSLMNAVKKRISNVNESAYSICMIDFDNFKLLNDKHGHLFGDKVLEVFSDFARRHIRKNDILGRYGGEEFVFVFNGISEPQSLSILKRIHSQLNQYFIKKYDLQITFSAGVFFVDSKQSLSYEELLDKVDTLLYEAKKNGRGRAMGRLGEFLFLEPKKGLTHC